MAKRKSKQLMGYFRERKLNEARRQCAVPPVKLMCSRCGEPKQLQRTQLLKAGRLRCSLCGGPLNRAGEV